METTLRPSGLVDDVERAALAAEIMKALGHPIRLRIVALLCKEDCHVNHLADRLGTAQAIVSQQLRILRNQRLVAVVRDGGKACYRIARRPLLDLMTCVEACCSGAT